MLFSELKASRPCALERFASYDESLYLKLARVIEDKYQPRLGSDYPDIIAMKGKVDLLGSIAGITLVVKSEGFDVNGFAQQLVAAHVERLKTLSVDAEQKKIDDDELKYNAGIDAKRVKAIVEIAADLQKDAISEKERDTLKILRDTLFNELLKDPKRLSSLVVTFPSAEVTTSRQRVQEAIADAQPKKK